MLESKVPVNQILRLVRAFCRKKVNEIKAVADKIENKTKPNLCKNDVR